MLCGHVCTSRLSYNMIAVMRIVRDGILLACVACGSRVITPLEWCSADFSVF